MLTFWIFLPLFSLRRRRDNPTTTTTRGTREQQFLDFETLLFTVVVSLFSVLLLFSIRVALRTDDMQAENDPRPTPDVVLAFGPVDHLEWRLLRVTAPLSWNAQLILAAACGNLEAMNVLLLRPDVNVNFHDPHNDISPALWAARR